MALKNRGTTYEAAAQPNGGSNGGSNGISAAHKVAPNRESEFSIPQLRAAVSGQVIAPDDPAYDTARTVFYGGFDRRPAAIVKVASATDVSRVVSLARDTGLELAIRSGGHSMAGYGVSDGGLVIDLSAMKGLEIDVAGRTAWAEAGLTAGEYTTAAAEHGLATGFGDTGSVGIGGITVGGGIGYLVRKYGMTIDDLLAAEIVTADGQLRHVDATTEPDLFWAIRGGGGNFGVVTRFKFRLHPVDTIVGGMMILPASPDILLRFVAEAEAAPEELSIIANVMKAPPMPFLPKEVHGQTVTMLLMVYTGDTDAGERAIAPFRALATPIVDMIRPMPYPEMYADEGGEGFHPRAAGRNLFIDQIDAESADLIFEQLRASTAFMAAVQVRVLGGAMARVPNDATAFAHRHRHIMLNVASLYMNPAEAETHEAWVSGLAAALRREEGGAYVNFIGDEGIERVREAYPGTTWDRLVAVKTKYDPTNLFRLNQNIPPTPERADQPEPEGISTN